MGVRLVGTWKHNKVVCWLTVWGSGIQSGISPGWTWSLHAFCSLSLSEKQKVPDTIRLLGFSWPYLTQFGIYQFCQRTVDPPALSFQPPPDQVEIVTSTHTVVIISMDSVKKTEYAVCSAGLHQVHIKLQFNLHFISLGSTIFWWKTFSVCQHPK